MPLSADLLRRLRPWHASKPAGERVWPENWAKGKEAGVMLKIELIAARAAWIEDDGDDQAERERREKAIFLAYREEVGCCADFHALRHTIITRLVRACVKPEEAQMLAQHSSISLTMDRDAHLGLHAVARAGGQLPSRVLTQPAKARLCRQPAPTEKGRFLALLMHLKLMPNDQT